MLIIFLPRHKNVIKENNVFVLSCLGLGAIFLYLAQKIKTEVKLMSEAIIAKKLNKSNLLLRK